MTVRWPAPPPLAVPLSALPPQPAPRRIKVLHVVTRFIAGAGGNTLLSALGADRRRYDTWIAGGPGGPLWARARRNGVTTVELEQFREVIAPTDDVRVLGALVRLIHRERFTVVHTHSTKAGILGRTAAWSCGTPVVVHTFHGFSTHEFMSGSRRRTYLALERLMRPLTDQFIAVAPQVAREAVELRLAPPGRVVVVPSAVETNAGASLGAREVHRVLGVPDGARIVGTVGRVDVQKAPLDFIHMAQLVATARPDARFVMIGDGPLLEAARGEACRRGVDVVFTGFRADAAAIAARFDVFVVASLFEGLGRALTEALASARPVAATAVNGVVDLVQPGSTGLLSPPADPEALARNVVWLLDHPAQARQMGEAARACVGMTFDPTLMCGLIDEVYGRLLGLPATAPAAD